jgi:phosphoglycerate dehydrogenase-like enzyme
VTLTYLCTLPLPDEWFDELRRRLPDVEVVRAAPGEQPAPETVARVDLLHTSEWFPEASAAPALRCVQLDTSGVDHVRRTSLWATDVPIATLGGIAPVPMAEYAMMAVLELAHRMPLIEVHRARRT